MAYTMEEAVSLSEDKAAEVTVQVPEENGEAVLDDAYKHLQQAIFTQGVCKLELPSGTIPAAEAHQALDAIEARVQDITTRLTQRGIDYKRQTERFAFKEVASRCRGRLDIRIDTQHEPFSTLADLPLLHTLPQAVLGSDAKLNYTGVVVSLPGSEDQAWHVDGNHLFPHVQLPPHAVTVFIPLEDVSDELGSPQFLPGTQLQAERARIEKAGDSATAVTFPLRRDHIVMFDYRTVHRGVANQHTAKSRPLMYQVYSKPWFGDVVNFGSSSLFDEDATASN